MGREDAGRPDRRHPLGRGAGLRGPSRVCIYGGSYGGYASLMAVAKEPDLYKCAVGYAGVYDLEMMYHKGDVSERESGTLPAPHDRHRRNATACALAGVPWRTGSGAGVPRRRAQDERAPPEQTAAMRDALKAAGHPAEEVILEPNEMHGFYAEDAQFNLYAKMLAFFDKYISAAAPAATK